MRNSHPVVLLVFFLASSTGSLHAQATKSDPADQQGWFGASLDADLRNKWKISLGYQARLYNDLKTYNGSYWSVEAEKKVTRHIALQAEYRLALVQKGVYNRFSIGGSAAIRNKKAEWELRQLFQNQLQDFDNADKPSQSDLYSRTRLKFKYPLYPYVDFYLSTEPILKLNDQDLLDNLRNQVGLKFRFSEQVKTDVYYIYRPDFAKSYTRTYHTVGVELIYSWKRSKKTDQRGKLIL